MVNFICSSGAQSVRNELERCSSSAVQKFFDPMEAHKIMRIFRRIHFRLNLPCQSFWLSRCPSVSDGDFLIIFDGKLNDEMLPFLSENISGKIIYYFWNPVSSKKQVDWILKYADLVATFDPRDSNTYNLAYVPAFLSDIGNFTSSKKSIDLAFVGRLKGRQRELTRVTNFCMNINLKKYFYIVGEKRNADAVLELKKKPLPFAEYRDVIKRSRAILDITAPGQTGLTIRGLEALGAGVKVVTDNHHLFELMGSIKGLIHIDEFLSMDKHQIEEFLSENHKQDLVAIRKKFGFEEWLKSLTINFGP